MQSILVDKMIYLTTEKWKSGKGELIDYKSILDILRKVSCSKNHKIIIGTDSIKITDFFVFTNAICIINDNNFFDRKYFYLRTKIKNNLYYNLSKKLLRETEESIFIALNIRKNIKHLNIEIHSDVNSNTDYASGKYKNMITGYIKGCNFIYKIKPDAFVASGIADYHTRTF